MKTMYTGIPIRKDFIKASDKTSKTTLLVLGGSLGSEIINKNLRLSLPALLKRFRVVHVCGEGKIETGFKNIKGYEQHEFIGKNFFKLLKMADLVVTRGGATTLYELIYFKKPALIIPLSRMASRGDQIANANYFDKKHCGEVLLEENLESKSLIIKLLEMRNRLHEFTEEMKKIRLPDSEKVIVEIINNNLRNK